MSLLKHYKQYVLYVGVLLMSIMSVASAARTPKALVTDYRVKQVTYDPNQVFQLMGTYGYQTAIEFSHAETIKVVTLGDSIAWQTVPYRNRLFIKPVEARAKTNMTVITDKRTYFFKLDSTHSSVDMTYLVRFHYPKHQTVKRTGDTVSQGIDALAHINLDYGSYGDKRAIPLKRAFDDGQFTYFLFEHDADVPSVYVVGQDGTESIVNTRREGAYLVVERTAERFTLRNGADYLCVKNGLRTVTPDFSWKDYAN